MAREKIKIEAEVDGYKGYGEILWIQDDGFNAPHWSVWTSVPYQDAKLNIVGYKNMNKAEAIKRGKMMLEQRLSRCTLCC